MSIELENYDDFRNNGNCFNIQYVADGTVINFTSEGIWGSFVVGTGAETDNRGTILVSNIDANRYARRIYSGAINVKWFGAKGDYNFVDNTGTDDSTAIVDAISAGSNIYIPEGNYLLTQTLDLQNLGGVKKITGVDFENSILWFNNIDAIACRPSGSTLRDFGIINTGGTSGFETQRANISSGIIGLKVNGNSCLVENVRVYGFDKGIQVETKFYNNFIACDLQYNLTGLYNTDNGNFNHSIGCKYSLNYEKNIWVETGSHQFNTCSIEGCSDYSNKQANHPNGGVLVGLAVMSTAEPTPAPYISNIIGKPVATFVDCYSEDCNWFFHERAQVSRMTGGANTRFNASAPVDVSDCFRETTDNILQPPYYGNWVAGDNVINNSSSNTNFGFRYSEIVSNTQSGTTKRSYTLPMTAAHGLLIPTTVGDDFHIYFGCWVQIRSANFTNLSNDKYPQFLVEAKDVGGTTFVFENVERTNPVNFDPTAVNRWQYLGFMTPARNTFSTGTTLSSMQIRIELGAATEDHSASNRVMWISNPEMRFLFVDAGQQSGRASQIAFQQLSEGAPTWNQSFNANIGTTSFPNGATNTLAMFNGTPPNAGLTDHTIFYSSDLTPGNTIPSIYTEGTGIVGTGTPAVNRTIAVNINGQVYYLLASTVPT